MRILPLLTLAACFDLPTTDEVADPGIGDVQRVVVMTTASTTYDVGALTTVRLDAIDAPHDVATLHGDAVVVVDGGIVWVVQRLQTDTVRRYEPGTWRAPVWEASTGRGSNPQDVALCGDALFVSRLEEASLSILDPDDGHALGEIDLSGEADGDGLPEAVDLVVDDGRLLVGLQRLDRRDAWVPDPHGRVVAIDCATHAIVDRWDVGPDPVLVAAPSGVLVVDHAGVRWLGEEVPALATIDGAAVVDVAFGADGRGAFVARDGDRHVLGCLDAELRPTILGTADNFVADVAIDDRGQAWFAVRQGWTDPGDLGGARVVDLDGCGDLGWTRTTFAPFSITFY